MANNLHVSYDLYNPGQNYEKVFERIKSLGAWAKVHKSFWYVNSTLTPSEAIAHIKPALDANDRVYVVDATNNVAAWNTLPDDVAELIKREWTR